MLRSHHYAIQTSSVARDKVHPIRASADTQRWLRYNSNTFETSARQEGCQHPPPPDPFANTVQEAGWASGSVGTGAENLAPLQGVDPWTIQPVASRYNDWAIPAHKITQNINNMVIKVKWSRYRPDVAQRVGRGIALLFHDCGTRRGEWSAARPGRTLPPGKTLYPFYRRLGGPQGRSGRAENLVPPGLDPGTSTP